MEVTRILTADINDIIFDGRNKDYGAYELRTTYNYRLLFSLASMFSLCIIVCSYFYFNRKNIEPPLVARVIEIPGNKLEDYNKHPKVPELPKPPQKSMAPMTRERIYTKPLIMDDKDIKENERPPEVNELNDVKIGVKNIEGIAAGIIAPPGEILEKGIIEAPVKGIEDQDKIFIRVEKESEYPGGKSAWMRYLLKTFRYPQEAQEKGIEGSVIVQFIVNREGYVSDVTVIDGPRELWEEAIRVISKSGQWTPAIQNGRQVKSYKKQAIVFRLEE